MELAQLAAMADIAAAVPSPIGEERRAPLSRVPGSLAAAARPAQPRRARKPLISVFGNHLAGSGLAELWGRRPGGGWFELDGARDQLGDELAARIGWLCPVWLVPWIASTGRGLAVTRSIAKVARRK